MNRKERDEKRAISLRKQKEKIRFYREYEWARDTWLNYCNRLHKWVKKEVAIMPIEVKKRVLSKWLLCLLRLRKEFYLENKIVRRLSENDVKLFYNFIKNKMWLLVILIVMWLICGHIAKINWRDYVLWFVMWFVFWMFGIVWYLIAWKSSKLIVKEITEKIKMDMNKLNNDKEVKEVKKERIVYNSEWVRQIDNYWL